MPLRVMPLGDSITDGHNVPGGYRVRLWERFRADGHIVEFVGSGRNGPASLESQNHEGHTGWRIDEIDASISDWITSARPDVVLLMIGTNDVVQRHALDTAPNRLEELVNHITGLAPDAQVFVASITPLEDAKEDADAEAYNAGVRRITESLLRRGHRVGFVDMHSALALEDLADGAHPNGTGYRKIGDVWYEALRPLLEGRR